MNQTKSCGVPISDRLSAIQAAAERRSIDAKAAIDAFRSSTKASYPTRAALLVDLLASLHAWCEGCDAGDMRDLLVEGEDLFRGELAALGKLADQQETWRATK